MSQYNSSMFSDAVYLFGTPISPAPPWYAYKELPDGTKVSQTELVEQLVLAAFAYLYHKKLIDIALGERKFFLKTKTAKVKKLQATAPDISGLEAIIFSYILDDSHVYGITRALISRSSNPRREVLGIVKWNLLNRGILKRVEKGRVLFITTHKYVVNGDISKEEKQITELKKTLEELQSQGELYERILTDIKDGISSGGYG